MRVALVHDYLTQLGGAERVLKALTEIFPHAPIYTLIYDEKGTEGEFGGFRIKTSFLQRLPLARTHHRLFPVLMPYAIEQFDLKAYDLVISSSHSYAKGVITRPDTLHVCYCHTPLRYAWDDSQRYISEFSTVALIRKIIPFALNYLRLWDRIAADRVDHFIANSNFVADRIRKYYQREARVIYPPVNTERFKILKKPDDYFLIVGRLIPYKRVDIAIRAFNKLGLPLKVIGSGPELRHLRKMARNNIEFLGRVSDFRAQQYFSRCRAFIFPAEDDFGIVPVEAMAAGRPVIAYRGGGALETVEEEITGVFFDKQTPESLISALNRFENFNFDPSEIKKHALCFDKQIFKERIKGYLEKVFLDFKNKTP